MVRRLLIVALLLFAGTAEAATTIRTVWGFNSSLTIEYRLYQLPSTLLQDWTSTGVAEMVIGSASVYQVPLTITSIGDYRIDWRNAASVNSTATETISAAEIGSILSPAPDLRQANVRQTFVLATVDNAVRKVKTGRIDYTLYETKADNAADWSAPTSSKRLYFWYSKMGDVNPFKVGENN